MQIRGVAHIELIAFSRLCLGLGVERAERRVTARELFNGADTSRDFASLTIAFLGIRSRLELIDGFPTPPTIYCGR